MLSEKKKKKSADVQRTGAKKVSAEGHKIGRQVVKDSSAEVRREVRG